ncbi:MAG TPA: glycoside hydrolase family 66 protein, partial [Rugosimonospora sp.]|nr:glycoside hydrolase family 66 protein [Rugosimonospora sp.]
GKHEWPRWEHAGLLRPDGTVYELGGFLSIVDPADPAWLAHFRADLARAVTAGGFAGFHLDQYGYPRRAPRPDGATVDLAAAFDTLIRAVREELPDARLIFNNVNDFPVWATTASPQDATYTEVWQPHDTLADLAAVATRSRTLAPERPAVVAAYQTAFDKLPTEAAELATKFTMATLFSHGATQLLCGESGNVLVDPYYVRNHAATPSTVDMLARWYDLLVAAGDILLAPRLPDVTRSVAGELNGEVDVAARVPVSHHARAGTVWRRVVGTARGTVVHLINLVGQDETGWDTAKAPVPAVGDLTLRVRRVGPALPKVYAADPDRGPRFTEIPVTVDGEYAVASLPALGVWQIVLVEQP